MRVLETAFFQDGKNVGPFEEESKVKSSPGGAIAFIVILIVGAATSSSSAQTCLQRLAAEIATYNIALFVPLIGLDQMKRNQANLLSSVSDHLSLMKRR